jgi:hypothetical protein
MDDDDEAPAAVRSSWSGLHFTSLIEGGSMSLRNALTGLVLVALAAPGVACHHMAAVDAPVEYIDGAKPSRIWVTRPSGETFIVEGPQLFGDTLVGYVNGEYRELEFRSTDEIVVRKPARARTALAVAGGIAGVVGFAYLISGSGSAGDNRRFNQDCDDDPDQPGCS